MGRCQAPDQVSPETFLRVAQTLERGLFDAFFLGDGQRVRENRGAALATDIAGRPDAITQLSALAGVTSRIGLVATQNTTYSLPVDLVRRLGSLDVLSDGRAGWNIVTTDNAWTGENFRRGGWLPHEHRYERATELVELAKEYWVAWSLADVATDARQDSWLPADRSAVIARHSDLLHATAISTVPSSKQGGRCCSRPAIPSAAVTWRPVMPTSCSRRTTSSTRPLPTHATSGRDCPPTAGPRIRSESFPVSP